MLVSLVFFVYMLCIGVGVKRSYDCFFRKLIIFNSWEYFLKILLNFVFEVSVFCER